MAIAYRGTGTTVYWNNANTTRNIANPTGTAAGDLLVMLISDYPTGPGSGGVISTPSGWTLQRTVTGTNNSGQPPRFRLFWRIADLSSLDNPNLTPSTLMYGGAAKFAISDVDTTTPIHTDATPTILVGFGAMVGPTLTATRNQMGVSIAISADGVTGWGSATPGTTQFTNANLYLEVQVVTQTGSSGNLGSVTHNTPVVTRDHVVFGLLIEESFPPSAPEADIAFTMGNFTVAIAAEVPVTEASVAFTMGDFTVDVDAEVPNGAAAHVGFTMGNFGVSIVGDAVAGTSGASATIGVTVGSFAVESVGNTVPVVPPPEPLAPLVWVTLWDRSGIVHVADIVDAFDCQWQEVVNEVGSGKFSYPLASADAALIQRGQIVKCHIYNVTNVFEWRIETVEIERISQDEEFGQIINVTGLGTGQRLGDAKIYPPKGVNQVPPVETRSFSFASPDYDDSAWVPAVQKAFFGDLTTEWTGVVDLELVPAPFGWPILPWNPAWIWTDISATNKGVCYFRKTFDLDIQRQCTIIATGDNFWTLYLDGVALIGDNTFQEAWNEHRRVELLLEAGSHTLAAVVDNVRESIAGLLVGIYADQGFTCTPVDPVEDADGVMQPQDPDCVPNPPLVVYVTDASWLCLGYPEKEPGMSPGRVMLQLLHEAQARGQLLNFVADFTETVDSEGTTWLEMPEVGASIGDSMLDILKTMTDGGWCDWWVRPINTAGNFVFSMYADSARGADITGCVFAAEVNISDITHGHPGRLVNRMLVKYGSGLFVIDDTVHQAAIGEIIEEFFTADVSDRVEAERQAQRALTIAIAEEPAITLTLEPNDGNRPYVDFFPGDACFAPNESGGSQPYRVLGITITQDDFGDPIVSLEINRRTYSPEAHRESLLKTIGSGIVGHHAGSERVANYKGSGD